MRETCLYCVRKHLSQAIVLNIESKLGHPLHRWLAIGHLAEAEAESLHEFPELAKSIRDVRQTLENNEDGEKELEIWRLLNQADQSASKE